MIELRLVRNGTAPRVKPERSYEVNARDPVSTGAVTRDVVFSDSVSAHSASASSTGVSSFEDCPDTANALTRRAIDAVAAGSFRDRQPPEIAGTGYVVLSLEAALWAFQGADDFGEAVLTAVNLGDDADTTGAVCGQLAGACWRASGIPAEWRDGLARKDIIEPILAKLLDESE